MSTILTFVRSPLWSRGKTLLPLTQRAWVRLPVGSIFLINIFPWFFSTVRQMSEKLRPPCISEYHWLSQSSISFIMDSNDVWFFLLSSDIRSEGSIAIVKNFYFDFLMIFHSTHSQSLKICFRKNVCVCLSVWQSPNVEPKPRVRKSGTLCPC